MNQRITGMTAIAAALGLVTAMAAAPVLAQEDPYEERGAQPPAEGQAAEVSEEKIDKFVDALSEIRVIQEEASAELEATSDTQEAQEVQQAAQQKMIEAVEAAGLSVEEYNQIAALMGSDPELQERIHSKLDQRS
jgi:hypothetical protein